MGSARLFLLLAASPCFTVVRGDVPLGVCHQCEANCFSDCSMKYHKEIIQADRREYEQKQRMLRENGGGHLSARGLAGVRLDSLVQEPSDPKRHLFSWRTANPDAKKNKVAEQQALVRSARFAKCLLDNKCPSHSVKSGTSVAKECAQFVEPSASLLALRGSGSASKGRGSQCAMRCADEIAQDDMANLEKPSLLEEKGPYPMFPVRKGMFAKGVLTLDFCLKSCLAVTCGCSDAPGFDAIDQMFGAIKHNIAVGFPVEDTNPEWQYHPATHADCARGMPGKKVSENLFIYTGSKHGDGGWVEVCTVDLINAAYGAAYAETKTILTRCRSQTPEDADFGCIWNNKEEKCLVGFVPVTMECQVRGKRDLVENTEEVGDAGASPAQRGEYLDKANGLMDRYASDGDNMSFD